jgi:hypothetical protein
VSCRFGDALAHQLKPVKPRQCVDAIFYLLDEMGAVARTEEVRGGERGLDLGDIATTDDRPSVLEEPFGDALRPAVVL